MSTRYTNAAVNDTFGKPPYTFTNPDGTEGVAIPPHVSQLLGGKNKRNKLIFFCSLLVSMKTSLSQELGSRLWTNINIALKPASNGRLVTS